MSNLKKILIDADIVSHFITAGEILHIGKIFKNQIVILDIVYNELERYKAKKTEIDNIINFKILEKIAFPINEIAMRKEYLWIKNKMFKGDGESACLAYVRFSNDIIGSSNLRDIAPYCKMHDIEYVTTMDFLYEALKIGYFTENRCDQFIAKVLKAGSKLPVNCIKDYIKL